MHRKTYRTYLLLTSLLLVSACNITRKVPAGDTLYTKTKVDIKDRNTSKRELDVLKADLTAAVLPKPNKEIFGIRFKLAFYNMAGDSSKPNKGLRKWLRKIGEPPVLGSQFNLEKNEKLLANILENRGFFHPSVDGEFKLGTKTSSSTFNVTTGEQYKIRNVVFVEDASRITKDIAAQKERTLLAPGAPYNLDLIKGERERIDKQLKERGYYYFVPDYLIVRADTGIGNHEVDMHVMLKAETPEEARQIFYINKVYINPNYRLGMGRLGGNMRRRQTDTTATGRRFQRDTLYHERYFIVGNTKMYKPFIFTQAMQFYPGDPYNRTDQNIALNRLVNMGTFKFVKNEFDQVEENLLNVYYNLTPYPKKSLRAELGGYTKNDSRVGSQVSLSWRNRNTFRGAELFAIKGTAGFETQFGGGVKRPNTYQFGIEPSLTFPRFVVPFVKPKSSSLFVPRTTIKLGYDLLLREDLYRIHSVKGNYGFQWKENVRTEHQLYPINITYVNTDTLGVDTNNTNVSNLVFNGLIIGPTYQFTYNTRGAGTPNKSDFYFDGLIDLSGNILGWLQRTSLEETKTNNPKRIFGAQYAQYAKVQADLRHYFNYGTNPNSILASRFLAGFGIPYGNSGQLPNIKQFYSGGNSSLRGFPSRLVGPGTFWQDPDDASITNRFIETSGDIKLEANLELRGQLYRFIHGAVFVDAGNIWTYRDYPDSNNALFPGGAFTNKFLSQVAANIGAGVRFDFSILVLRLDFGIPVRKPYLKPGERWVFNEFDFGDSQWRKRNFIFNLGIGYPF
jgi:Outer membrane protein/protective antigen OMA87